MKRAILLVHGVAPANPGDPPGFCVPKTIQVEVPDDIEPGTEVNVVLACRVEAVLGT